MAGHVLSLTVQEKILIHLYDMIRYEDAVEKPIGVTQTGIALAVTIQQKHVPRALKRLRDKNSVRETMDRVEGAKQRRKVYFLTHEGILEATTLRDQVMGEGIVLMNAAGQTEKITVASVLKLFSPPVTILELIHHIADEGLFDCNTFEAARARWKLACEAAQREELDRFEIYEVALRRAWSDGVVSKDEYEMLKDLKTFLNITDAEHFKIEERTTSELANNFPNKLEIYKDALERAWVDGKFTRDEKLMLDNLRRRLQITTEENDASRSGPTS